MPKCTSPTYPRHIPIYAVKLQAKVRGSCLPTFAIVDNVKCGTNVVVVDEDCCVDASSSTNNHIINCKN